MKKVHKKLESSELDFHDSMWMDISFTDSWRVERHFM